MGCTPTDLKARFIRAPSTAPAPEGEAAPAPSQPVADGSAQRSIGDIIRTVRGLSDEQIERIARHQHEHGVKFGEAAVALRMASGEEVLWALSQQFHYPYALTGKLEKRRELVVANDPFSTHAEVFRELRSQLMNEAEAPLRAVAVVSPRRGDGRSYVASNLAVAFSQLGNRTLLIDADMRSPTQHRWFGHRSPGGLSGMLAGRQGADAIQPVSGLPNLYLLGVGVEPPNPLELLQRPALGLLILRLLGRFDHVVVDTPAAELGADWRVIAAACRAALVVGREGRTALADLKRMRESMQRSQARVAGVVINDA